MVSDFPRLRRELSRMTNSDKAEGGTGVVTNSTKSSMECLGGGDNQHAPSPLSIDGQSQCVLLCTKKAFETLKLEIHVNNT